MLGTFLFRTTPMDSSCGSRPQVGAFHPDVDVCRFLWRQLLPQHLKEDIDHLQIINSIARHERRY